MNLYCRLRQFSMESRFATDIHYAEYPLLLLNDLNYIDACSRKQIFVTQLNIGCREAQQSSSLFSINDSSTYLVGAIHQAICFCDISINDHLTQQTTGDLLFSIHDWWNCDHLKSSRQATCLERLRIPLPATSIAKVFTSNDDICIASLNIRIDEIFRRYIGKLAIEIDQN